MPVCSNPNTYSNAHPKNNVEGVQLEIVEQKLLTT